MALSNPLQVYEILEKAASKKAKKDKVAVLREHGRNMALRDVLQGTFDERIEWKLPTGYVPYTPAREEAIPATLRKEHLKFKFFVAGLRDCERLDSIKREKMFLDIVETIHPKDAELLINMINKKPPMKGITKALVKEAFPDLIS